MQVTISEEFQSFWEPMVSSRVDLKLTNPKSFWKVTTTSHSLIMY